MPEKTADLAAATVDAAAATAIAARTDASNVPLTSDEKNVRPLTTREQDEHTKGQRRINLIWEFTQALVAVMVTAATIFSALRGTESLVLGNAFTLIIALYFVRSNHTKVGGIGGTDSR